MNFDYTYETLLEGLQTQCTRRYNPIQHFDPVRRVLLSLDGQALSFVGKLEPVEVKHKHHTLTIGAIRILNIRQMQLRNITTQDAQAEGCRDLNDFAALWILANGRFQHDTSVLVYSFQLVEVYHDQLAKIPA